MTITLVAHRGDCQFDFENTIQSIQTAIGQGIKCIEIDIQFTKDNIPILFHDRNLKRMTGVNSLVADLNYTEISQLKLLPLEDNRHKRSDIRISSLADVVELLKQHPDVTLFVEVKRVNFLHFTYLNIYQHLLALLKPIFNHVVIISFSYRFLRLCQKKSTLKIGYVLPNWQSYSIKMLMKLQPKYIFCDIEIVPQAYQFTNQSAIWVLYEVAEMTKMKDFNQRGVEYFETFFPVRIKKELLVLKGTLHKS